MGHGEECALLPVQRLLNYAAHEIQALTWMPPSHRDYALTSLDQGFYYRAVGTSEQWRVLVAYVGVCLSL